MRLELVACGLQYVHAKLVAFDLGQQFGGDEWHGGSPDFGLFDTAASDTFSVQSLRLRNDLSLLVKELLILIITMSTEKMAYTQTIVSIQQGSGYAMNDIKESSILGKRLLELRKSRGWSQPELAKKVGITDAIIGRYERGATTPSVDIAKRLADTLGVTLDHLVSENSEPNLLHDKETYERCKALSILPQNDKEHAYFLIDMIIRDSRARKAYG
jgi:transcriptional regulator with XRE-family HTH domain